MSKALDCLPHNLLSIKLYVHGFGESFLEYIKNYLSNRKQRIKINSSHSNWNIILYGVPQGLILGSLLFNTFLCDLFLFLTNIDIAGYVNDNSMNKSTREVLRDIKTAFNSFLLGFKIAVWELTLINFMLYLAWKTLALKNYCV